MLQGYRFEDPVPHSIDEWVARQKYLSKEKYKRMPKKVLHKKKRVGKRGYKVRHKKYGKHARPSTSIVRNPTLIPDRTFVKLKYVDNTVNALTFNNSPYSNIRHFYGNAPFDPDLSIGNWAIYGYNQWAALYNKVRCFSSKIRIKFYNVDADHVYRVCVVPTDLVPGDNVMNNIFAQSQPYSKSRILPTKGDKSGGILTNYMSTVKMEGDKGAMYDVTFASNVTNLPTNAWYWNVYGANMLGSSITGSPIITNIEIIYYCEFYSRKDVSGSVRYFQGGEDPVQPVEPGSVGQTGPSGHLGGYY